MRVQSEIRRTLGQAESLERVARILSREQFASRRAASRRICEEFDFRDRRGRLQVAGCLKVLAALARQSARIVLPPAASEGVSSAGQPALLAAGAQLAAEVPERLEQVRGLVIVPVADRAQRRVWNTLIATEHRQGITTFAGARMRYLVDSAHGYPGALGFAASALRRAARERWMAWSGGRTWTGWSA